MRAKRRKKLTTLDIMVLVIIGGFTVIGLLAGFSRIFFKFTSLFIVVVLAYLLCETTSPIVNGIFGETLNSDIQNWMINCEEAYAEEERIFFTQLDWSDENNVKTALSHLGFSSIMTFFTSGLMGDAFKSFETAALIEVLPPYLTHIAVTIITFLLLIIIGSIILLIIKLVIKSVIKTIPMLNFIDQIAGGILGFAMGWLLYSGIFLLLTSFPIPVDSVSQFQNSIPEQIETSRNSAQLAYIFSDTFVIDWLKAIFSLKI